MDLIKRSSWLSFALVCWNWTVQTTKWFGTWQKGMKNHSFYLNWSLLEKQLDKFLRSYKKSKKQPLNKKIETKFYSICLIFSFCPKASMSLNFSHHHFTLKHKKFRPSWKKGSKCGSSSYAIIRTGANSTKFFRHISRIRISCRLFCSIKSF